MFTTLNTPGVYNLILLVGVFVAIAYRNAYGVIPGGLIIPGSLIVLLIMSPLWCATVIILSAFVYWVYEHWFRRTDYKRRTPMYVLACLSLGISSIVSFCYVRWGWLPFSLDTQVGSIVPGIIAFNLSKQDAGKVTRAIATCAGTTLAIVGSVYALLSTSGILSPTPAIVAPSPAGQLNYPLIHFAIALGTGYLIYRHHDIRSGGYTIAPVVALALLEPFTAVRFLVGCTLVYHATRLFCEWTLTVGLRRYVVVLSLSTLYLWGSELWLQAIDPSLPLFQGSSYLLNIAMLSYVNDAILYRQQSIFRYLVLTTGISMAGIVAVDVFSYLLA